jgi:ACS family hexuronate transporter-like MFS transporter
MTTRPAAVPAMSRVRWRICALLFFATTINYVDRQVLSFLALTLQTTIGWTTVDYGYITAAFQAAYGVGLLGAGWFIDRLGTRKGFATAVAVWSLAAIAHAAAFSAFTFGIARALLGLGESASFPACNKSVAEWFPKKERALAFGVFNAGANIGAVIVPLVVPWLAITFGWQWAFVATGALGFVWLAFWWFGYAQPAEHRKVSPAELALIQSDPPDKVQTLPWSRLFPKRETWAFALGKALTDPIWWFYLFWFPRYLQETFGLSLQQIVWPTVIVYNICTIGSVGGGSLPSLFLKRGWTLNSARKTAMLICAVSVAPVLYAPYCKNLWLVVALIGLATAAHQGWSANLFTLVSDMFPRAAVASVTGIGGMLGGVASVLMQVATGYIVQLTHSYLPLFLFAGVGYVVALAVIHSLSPKLAPAQLD